MIETVNIVASASIGNVDFGVTYVETRQSYGGSPGYAKIKGVTDNPGEIERGDRVTASISGERIFTGSLKKATQNTEGIVTVEAYDLLSDLDDQLVTLNTEEPRRSTNVLRTLFSYAGYTVYGSPEDAEPGSVYVADGSEFPGGDPPGHHEYGSAQAGDPLSTVVDEITKRLGGVYWVDGRNVLRVEPFPYDVSFYDPQYILDVNSGEDSENKQRVLVSGGSATSEFGLAASYSYSKFSPKSEARFDDSKDDERKTKTINDSNIITQKELDSRAMSGMLDEGRNMDAGTITISGHTAVSLFDTVRVPQLTYNLSGSEPFQNVLGSGRYTIRQITHIADAQDGYQTELDLAPEYGSVANSISGPAVGLATQLAERFTARLGDFEELGVGPTNPATE